MNENERSHLQQSSIEHANMARPERGKVHVHVNIHPLVSLIITFVIGFILLVSWAIFAIFHQKDFIASTVELFHDGTWAVRAIALLGLLWLAVYVLGHFIERVLHPLIHALHMFLTAIGQPKRNRVQAVHENYTVVDGQFYQVSQDRTTYNLKGEMAPKQIAAPDEETPDLPTFVRYEDVRPHIPRGHTLVGVSGYGVETKEDHVRALLWIVGNSGTGKTNSTVIRVDDDVKRGHRLLGVDPHAFKDDSLTNALRGYAPFFLQPIARRLEDIDTVLQTFLDEFEERKNNDPPYNPITLVVDEVGSLTMDIDKSNKLEGEVARKLREIARICGQESRGFQMYGIFISQNAAGLAWLRRYALMVLAHQVLMMSERLLVCNQNRDVANDMETWPKGRTLVYGIAFPQGQMLVQQPVCTPRIVDADPAPVPQNVSFLRVPDAQKKGSAGTIVQSIELPAEPSGTVPSESLEVPRFEKVFDQEQEVRFARLYREIGNSKEVLRLMHLGNAYGPYASYLIEQRNLKKVRA